MLYIIGLGLDKEGISKQGLEAVKKCKKVYIENYTVDFPYSLSEIKEIIGKKVAVADREKVESLEIVDEAKKLNVALLVYGSPLTATTHISLVQEAKALRIRYRIIYSASILDAVAETGLQIYKFGKIASMPKWDEKKNYEPDSFMDIIKENKITGAHSLILTDIGLGFDEALKGLEKASEKKNIKIKKIIVCQSLGTEKQRIFYGPIEELKDRRIKKPYCIIIPGKMHFVEKEVVKSFEI